jgi:hypothetical protein
MSGTANRRIHLELNKTATVGLRKHPKTTVGLQRIVMSSGVNQAPAEPSARSALWVGGGVQTYEVINLFPPTLVYSHLMADGSILRELGVTSLIIIDTPPPPPNRLIGH